MSGHNRWSKIKRKKGLSDDRKAKAFTRILKDIAVAVKEGGGTLPESNPHLKLAMDNARGVNMPKENMQRAIDKASGKDAMAYIETTYEGYGPHGIAIFVECTTDNIKRTYSDVRNIFSKHGGNLGTNGSLGFIFERKGIFIVKRGKWNEDDFTLRVIDAGAENIATDDEVFTITTSMENFGTMRKKLEEMKMETESAGLQMIPKTTVTLDIKDAKQVLELIEALEEDEDVHNVYHNLEITEQLAEAL
jgi:YebC/PmpR family DNA-binding regulatory protein